MLPRIGDGWGRRVFLSAESAAQAWESFALIALTSAGVCDRTLRPNCGRGAVPCPADCSASILPGLLTARLAGEMPSLREGDRYFWGCACERSKLLSCRFFPFLNPLLLNLVRLTGSVENACPASSRSGAYEHS